MRVVCNTSPLILLAKIHRLDLLHRLYDEVLVPSKVLKELEAKADLIILDDKEGRRVARSKGLRVTGTLGLLIEARERGLIPSIRRELDRLIEAGIWINEALYHRILQEFGE